jgi:gamma-glutamyltranspeptidase/glutathione hydrolase
MRAFDEPGRSTAYSREAMAATSHPLATLTALDVLRAGGNAVDAAIAAVATLCVVEPHMTGIGGDCFVLYAPASGGVVALNGSGRAPAAMTPDRLMAAGVSQLSPTSPHSITVPGAVAAWEALLEAHGTKSLGELLQPAIHHAEEGYAVTPRIAWDWQRHRERIALSEAGRNFYLPGGKAPEAGRVVRLPLLARTLRTIAERGAPGFYEGDVAERMVATLEAAGGWHKVEDFAATKAELVEPIQTVYRDVRVYECPPNGQGIVALLMLNILECFKLEELDPGSDLRLHLLAEAARLAYRDRDAALADPGAADVPTQHLLDKAYAKALAKVIDPERAMTSLPPPLIEPHSDTIYLTVVDRDLNAISFINSIYDAFGSGLVCPETGVVFHNRGRGFRLDPSHPNVIAPGKRPMHTIIPGLAFRNGELWSAFGVMGGHYQPVGHAQLITAMVDSGLDPQAAIDLPRIMPYPSDLEVESGVAREARRGLARRGHRVVDAASPLGGGQCITVDRRRGVLIGGSDHRKDGLALGY